MHNFCSGLLDTVLSLPVDSDTQHSVCSREGIGFWDGVEAGVRARLLIFMALWLLGIWPALVHGRTALCCGVAVAAL